MDTGFGMAHMKTEGAPLHPDDIDKTMSDEEIYDQARTYYSYYNLCDEWREFEQWMK